MPSFVALDFETANRASSSICSVGLVVVRKGEVIDTFYSLIQPEPNYYHYYNTLVHGLTNKDTDNAPIFPVVWTKLSPLLDGLPIFAHNKQFDEGCLKAAFKTYSMDYPDYEFRCTYLQARKRWPHLSNHTLNTVSEHCGFELTHHHHALADAEACAVIALHLLNEQSYPCGAASL